MFLETAYLIRFEKLFYEFYIQQVDFRMPQHITYHNIVLPQMMLVLVKSVFVLLMVLLEEFKVRGS